jgi:hypothetical protein
VLTAVGTIIWVLNLDGIIQASWSGLCRVMFTVLGVFLALLQVILQVIPGSQQSAVEAELHTAR